jgi:outer membrane autotransporter protein
MKSQKSHGLRIYRLWTAAASLAVIAGATSALGLVAIPTAEAQTFDQAASQSLGAICSGSGQATGQLDSLCLSNAGTTTGTGATSVLPAAAFIENRRRSVGGSEDKTAKPGASSDTAGYDLGGGLSAFVSAGGDSLNHHNNKFEDGYASAVPTIFVGADYRITDWMTAGLAVNYTYQHGTYDDGGSFDTHSYGPLLFASFTPLAGMFADVSLGYNRQNNSRTRVADASAPGGPTLTTGHASGDYDTDQYSAGFLAGYDHPLQGFTIGPRAGLNYVYSDVENYNESSNTGLALSYSGLNQSSLQSTLGAVATMPISTGFGVVQPQIGVSWLHEFLGDSRNVQAEYRQTVNPAASQFTFKREQPARDWAVIDVGVSAILPNQLQAFASFTTMQGNENFVSYGGLLGVRKAF